MDTQGQQRSGAIQSVERAVAVLKLFGESEPELGVTELARRLNLHKSTVSRLLSTLEAGGFVQQDSRSGRYRLGLQLATLAGLALTQYDLRDVARPLLEELARQADETITVSVLDGDVAVNIDQVLAPNPVKHLGWIGRRLPLHCTAAGKPLLACLPPETVRQLLAPPLTQYTPRTITNPAILLRELEHVRLQGFAVAFEEFEPDLSAVGCAIRDHQGEAVASVTLSGPTFRLPHERLMQLGIMLRHTSDRISAQLGYRPAGTAMLAAATSRTRAPEHPAATAATGATGTPAATVTTAAGAATTAKAATARRPRVGLAGPVFGN